MKRRTRLTVLGALAAALAPASAAAQEPQADEAPAPGVLCFSCHGEEGDAMEFADGVEASLWVPEEAYRASVHGRQDCTACHVGLDPFEHMDDDPPARAAFLATLESRCLDCHESGDGGAPAIAVTLHSAATDGTPGCADCHPAHAVTAGAASRGAASTACARCHEGQTEAFLASAHGAALAGDEHPDVPVCTDCHPGHRAQGTTEIARSVRLGQPCMGCHGDARRMEPYGVSTNVVSTYLQDFHGVSVKFYGRERADFSQETLVCADCHGVHDVMPMSATHPLHMKENLLGVCQRCHEDAAATFPDAWLSHYEPSLDKAPLVFLVKTTYRIFIPFVILGLSIQIFMHLVLLPLRQRRERRRAGGAPPPVQRAVSPTGSVLRFGRRSRLEHLVVMVTFVLLLLTGLPQKFHDARWASWLVERLGGLDTVRLVHRATGVVFAGVAVGHLVLAAVGVLRGRVGMSMALGRKDFRDAVRNLRWYAGLEREEPRFDRYDYRQKFEYWGLILGGTIMIVSGFVLFFPTFFAAWLPGQLIPAAKAAHSYEAMMALLTIVVWHMYGVHLNPECFPMDASIFTGRISAGRMLREHPIEYEREVLGGEAHPEEPEARREPFGPKLPTPA